MEYLIAFILVCLGAAIAYPAIGILGRRTLIKTMETSRLGSRPVGYVELKGRVEAIHAIESPYSQQPCVHFRTLVQEHRRRGKSSYWATVYSEADSCPFLLDDGTGKAWIDPRNAELDLRQDSSARTGLFGNDDELQAFLTRAGIASTGFFGFSRNMRVSERVLSPGDEVYVLGRASEPDEQGGHSPDAVAELAGRGAANLFISDSSEETLVSRLLWQAVGHFFVGGLLAAAGAAVVYFTKMA